MCINLRRGKAGMSQQFLDGTQIGAVFQQMGRESVPDGMGAHLLADGQLLHVFIEDAADACSSTPYFCIIGTRLFWK